MRVGQQQNNSTTKEYIRVAEKYISERQYDLAMKQLTIAQNLEPNNIYILAIIERIHRLAAEESNGGRFLAITVGDEFENGVKPNGELGPRPDEVEAQVKRLTTKASELLRRGAYETAFDSLMNAYLLDPVSPVVMESERTILPAIELMRKAKKDGSQRMGAAIAQPPSSKRPNMSMLTEEDSQRLNNLKREKEMERELHEREMWREASKTPRILDSLMPPDPPKMEPEKTDHPPSHKITGIFSKIRHGKFLG